MLFYFHFFLCIFLSSSCFFFLMIRRPPRSTLFPYNDALPISEPHRRHAVLRLEQGIQPATTGLLTPAQGRHRQGFGAISVHSGGRPDARARSATSSIGRRVPAAVRRSRSYSSSRTVIVYATR